MQVDRITGISPAPNLLDTGETLGMRELPNLHRLAPILDTLAGGLDDLLIE
jgi:hypothetical protein